jgi:hypothetical protein
MSPAYKFERTGHIELGMVPMQVPYCTHVPSYISKDRTGTGEFCTGIAGTSFRLLWEYRLCSCPTPE